MGDTFLSRSVQKELGLTDFLKEHFKEDYKEILVLSNYLFQESSPDLSFSFLAGGPLS